MMRRLQGLRLVAMALVWAVPGATVGGAETETGVTALVHAPNLRRCLLSSC